VQSLYFAVDQSVSPAKLRLPAPIAVPRRLKKPLMPRIVGIALQLGHLRIEYWDVAGPARGHPIVGDGEIARERDPVVSRRAKWGKRAS
jgi:hypothetical protein